MPGREFHVLYQNMTSFCGASIARNRAFTSGFSQIRLGSAASRVLVAGFAEVRNAGLAASALAALAANIDDALQGSYTVAAGLSAAGVTEYIHLATYAEDAANTFHVDGYGKVIGTSDGTQWTCYPATTLAAASLPAGLAPGSRGPAYVVGTIVSGADPSWQGRRVVALFTHTMYGAGDVYGGIQRLPGAVAAVYAAHKLPATVGYVLGGDFNASPRPVSAGGTSIAPVYAAAAGKPVSTTRGHAYDFFFTSPALAGAAATAWPQTMDAGAGLSQHAAVSLQLSSRAL